MAEYDIPDYFATFIADYFGERGEAWLAELPDLLAQYARAWELDLLPPFADLSFHYVAPVLRMDGSAAVLKLGVPEEESRTGIAFLRLCDGNGAVCLLEADDERCVLLMERASPGIPLTRLEDDDAATAIAADLMRLLWRPAPATHSFIPLARRLGAMRRLGAISRKYKLGGAAGPLLVAMLTRAQGLADDLLVSAPDERVLHGDLHHDNIVSAQRAPWLTIDPKGLVGDPGFDTGALMNNPYGRMETWTAPARHFARRADILAERLSYPRERILAWSYIQAVLSLGWEVLAGTARYPSWVARAEVLATLLDRPLVT
jgi:streptomycin 6-kinase